VTAPAGRQRTLLETIETQRLGCELAGSPLSAAVLEVVATDVADGGPFAELLAPVANAPFGDAVLLRLLAGLHRSVLEGRSPDLAVHYPSVGGRVATQGRGALAAAVRRAATDQAASLADDLTRNVQTNEVGRSAALLGGHLEVARLGLPLRVLEIGASAGLNLLFDRYRYVAGGAAFGPASSPLAFVDPWVGAAPDLEVPVEVAERRGCDVAPIDLRTTEGRTRLRSFVWGDMVERLARLDAALEIAAVEPPAVDAAAAGPWLAEQLGAERPGVATVVTHSIVLQYLGADERRSVVATIEAAGARASADAPVAWLRLEPGGDQAELRLTTWPGGEVRTLASSAYHGPPVAWRGSGRRGR
jgi:hypothetical protein